MSPTPYNPKQVAVYLEFTDPCFQAYRKVIEDGNTVLMEFNYRSSRDLYVVTVAKGTNGKPVFIVTRYWMHTICDFGSQSHTYRNRFTLFLALLLHLTGGMPVKQKPCWLLNN